MTLVYSSLYNWCSFGSGDLFLSVFAEMTDVLKLILLVLCSSHAAAAASASATPQWKSEDGSENMRVLWSLQSFLCTSAQTECIRVCVLLE